jgi:hemolysin activation/secretion protein
VVFAEGGWAKSNLTQGSDHLIGAGVGLRYSAGNLQLSADLATALEKPAAETRSNPWRLSLAATYRF